MHSLQPGTAIANINEKDAADSPAQKNLTDFGKLLALHAHELGLAMDLAEMFRDDPLSAELAFREMICGFARSTLADTFEALDDHGPSLDLDGTAYRKVQITRGRAMTTFGPVNFGRSRYRPAAADGSHQNAPTTTEQWPRKMNSQHDLQNGIRRTKMTPYENHTRLQVSIRDAMMAQF